MLLLLHQPIGRARGQATDIQIRAEEVLKNKKSMLEILSRNTGKTIEELQKTLTGWLSQPPRSTRLWSYR